jgi:CDP-glucose 4,6-dehydratase
MELVIDELGDVFKDKKVFITGHTGFKGTWLTTILKKLGAEILGYALEPEDRNCHFNMMNLKEEIHHVTGDIRDQNKLMNTLCDFQPEFVFHLAAQAIVKKSYDDPVDTFNTNVMGSVNLLESVKNCNSVRSLVYVTSDKCYENVEWDWGYRENDRLGGYDPYSASKAAAEIVFSSYLRSFFSSKTSLGAASTRAGNVIGGGDYSDNRIIPDCIRSLQINKPIILRNPTATRPWQHVLEPLSGYLLLAARLYNSPKKYSGSWNFGPATIETRTVEEVAKTVIKHFGKGEVIIESSQVHHEAQLLQLNCDRANQILHWYPRWDVDQTLSETANWYQKIIDGADASTITISQIIKYFKS